MVRRPNLTCGPREVVARLNAEKIHIPLRTPQWPLRWRFAGACHVTASKLVPLRKTCDEFVSMSEGGSVFATDVWSLCLCIFVFGALASYLFAVEL